MTAESIYHPETLSTPSFAEMVEQYGSRVYNTALGIVENAEDAEDITQEVFLKVFENSDSFRHEASLFTWIYRITASTALDFDKHRRRQKRGGLLTRIFGRNEAEQIPHFDHPGVALDKKEDARVLFYAMKKLPEKQRLAFLLHKTEGLTNSEIAAIFRISLQAAESLQVRAKENLRKYLRTYYENRYK